MLDYLYGPGRTDDPEGPDGSDNQNRFCKPKDMNGLGETEKPDELIRPNALKSRVSPMT